MAQRVIEVRAELHMQTMYVKKAVIQNPICLAPIRIHDYNLLYNKPILNNYTLQGEITLNNIGLYFASYDQVMEVLGGKDMPKDANEYLTGVKFITLAQYNSMANVTSVKDTIYYIVDYKTDKDNQKFGAICIGDGIKLIKDLPLVVGETDDEKDLINKIMDKVGVKVDEHDPEMLVFYH